MDSNGLASFLPLIILFAIFYFLIIRPQQKQQKAHAAMLTGLEKGDKIVTSGDLSLQLSNLKKILSKSN